MPDRDLEKQLFFELHNRGNRVKRHLHDEQLCQIHEPSSSGCFLDVIKNMSENITQLRKENLTVSASPQGAQRS